MNPLLIINKCMPDWVQLSSIDEKAEILQVVAFPLLDGGVTGEPCALTIKYAHNNISVFETFRGKKLPSACPERHINSDGSFCTQLDAGKEITTKEAAENWWAALASFFRCQYFAENRRYWPPERWLSHGAAAVDHLAMETIAKELGWEEEVKAAIEYKEGWLAGELPRNQKNSSTLVSQRLPCPRGCRKKKGKRSHPISRRDCCHKQQISRLVYHENNRRKKEAMYTQMLLNEGVTCCGTMNNCPLKQ